MYICICNASRVVTCYEGISDYLDHVELIKALLIARPPAVCTLQYLWF